MLYYYLISVSRVFNCVCRAQGNTDNNMYFYDMFSPAYLLYEHRKEVSLSQIIARKYKLGV